MMLLFSSTTERIPPWLCYGISFFTGMRECRFHALRQIEEARPLSMFGLANFLPRPKAQKIRSLKIHLQKNWLCHSPEPRKLHFPNVRALTCIFLA